MEQSDGKKGNVILVLDFGAQYAQLIANIVRLCGAYSLIFPYDISLEKIKEINPIGIILSGGPASVYAENAPMPDPAIFGLGIPIMGICYGHQVMAAILGGRVSKRQAEYGRCLVKVVHEILHYRKVKKVVWMSHQDSVTEMPPGFEIMAFSDQCSVAAMIDQQRNFISFQFHPEVEHTEDGLAMMGLFVKGMCHSTGEWNMPDFVRRAVEKIKAQVGEEYVIGAISGGVDSTTAATLVNRAIGDRFAGIFVNNGLLRKGEADQVIATLTELGVNFRYVDASLRFLKKLQGVSDPDKKRRIIGNEFIAVFEEEAEKLAVEKGVDKISFLVQGTLYPDVIESISAHGGPTAKIKRHHNVGGLPEKMNLELVEPFRELFKDEVRRVSEVLGLPQKIIRRHPFPGPGLGIRCLKRISGRRLETLREGDAILTEEIEKAGLYDSIGQLFLVLLNERSVGVQGDTGTYKWVAAIRSVDTTMYMTASATKFDFEFLERIAIRILNEVSGIGRVVYDFSPKPPSTIEWE